MNSKVYTELLKLLDKDEKSSSIFVARGQSGIGKTFCIDKFLEDNQQKTYIIRINAHPFDHSNYSTINNSIYKLISPQKIKKELVINILQKLALWIPRFGQQISSLIDSNIYNKSLNDIIRRAGINTEVPNVFELLKFLECKNPNIKTILYCDNIQWFDPKSWETILHLLLLIKNRNWLCIMLYTNDAETSILMHEEINKDLENLRVSKEIENFQLYDFLKCDITDIKLLCDSIFKKETSFTENQYNILYEYTEGLPLYVRIVLETLTENKYINSINNTLVSESEWDSEIIREILRNSIKNKIERIYCTIPKSQKILELGCVYNNFTEESIEQIFDIKDSYQILKEVEKKFRLIKYVFEDNNWIFEHSIFQDYIYRSLGIKSKYVHLQIATFLEAKNNPNDILKISLHYRLGENYIKAAEFALKEINLLLDAGCFDSALTAIYSFEEMYSSEILINIDIDIEYKFTKGKTMFHNVDYQSSLEIFLGLINYTQNDDNLATCYHWLARTYLKFNTQDDFKKAIDHLEQSMNIFEKQHKFSIVGDILMDLIVAYAHQNQKDKIESLYKDAEKCFNISKDRIGMLRLHRRCVIFMNPKLSAPILETVANSWAMLNISHEEIMALTNAAAVYIFMHEIHKAKELLLRALSQSIEIGEFGKVYIYNNLGVVNVFLNNYETAKNNFDVARKGKYRFVEQLIVDINESVLLAQTNIKNVTIEGFNRIYQDALSVGENDYIIPAKLNLGIMNYFIGNYNNSCAILETLEELLSEYHSNYCFQLWFNTLNDIYLKLNLMNKSEILINKYKNLISQNYNSIKSPKFAVIAMEFWSEN